MLNEYELNALGLSYWGELTVAFKVDQDSSLRFSCLEKNEGAGVLDLLSLLIHEGADEEKLLVVPVGPYHLGLEESLELLLDSN